MVPGMKSDSFLIVVNGIIVRCGNVDFIKVPLSILGAENSLRIALIDWLICYLETV